MCVMSRIEIEDLNEIIYDPVIPWARLNSKSVLVTGATGLIGRTVVNALLYYGCTVSSPPKVIAPVRNLERAAELFSCQIASGCPLQFVQWSAEQPLLLEQPVDYVIHCACQTSSSGFVQTPVETVKTAYLGTEHILSFAREKNVEHVVFLSTMEVYGTPQTDEKIDETYVGKIDPLTVRNCYPESKRLCENLCLGYFSEYNVPVSVARLTQTFGPGVAPTDGRVFAEFARCVINKQDIVLRTKGETKRSYLYTADAVRALLTILLLGQPGHAYNVSNESTYCTILEMAQMVAGKIAQDSIRVRLELDRPAESYGYAPVLHMNLDTTKLRQLGWTPRHGLQEMFERMISEF